nr:zinc finger, CCHC-type, retrotransposon Gag domain protein [Tanacetum cinerariifolium]
APVDAENWISHMEKIFDVMGCEDAFKARLVVYKFEGNALAWWKAYKQAKGAADGIEEEQAKNFQWGLHRSTLNHLMWVPLRATPTQFVLLVDVDTQESVIELLVLVSSVVKLAI